VPTGWLVTGGTAAAIRGDLFWASALQNSGDRCARMNWSSCRDRAIDRDLHPVVTVMLVAYAARRECEVGINKVWGQSRSRFFGTTGLIRLNARPTNRDILAETT
jgi:hypothetical protein